MRSFGEAAQEEEGVEGVDRYRARSRRLDSVWNVGLCSCAIRNFVPTSSVKFALTTRSLPAQDWTIGSDRSDNSFCSLLYKSSTSSGITTRYTYF